MKPSNDFQLKTEGDDYKLIITEIFPEDAGIYTCEAFNESGESFSSCTVVVNGKQSKLKNIYNLNIKIYFSSRRGCKRTSNTHISQLNNNVRRKICNFLVRN